jgi:hypothetical protein
MAIYQDSASVLLAGINSANSLTIKATDFVYSAPKDIRNTDKGIATGKNTQIKITADGVAGSTWSGKKNVTYNRLRVEDIVVLLGDTLAIGPSNATLFNALVGLNQRYGFVFAQSDLLDAEIEWNAEKTSGKLLIKANPTSIGWMGEYKFNIVKGDETLVTSITTPVLTGLKYPNGQMGSETVAAIMAQVYSYPFNFSAYRDQLLAFTPGILTGTPLTTMVGILNGITTSTWYSTTQSNYGLAGAEVLSVGLNDAVAMPTNSKYKYVLALKLPATTTNIVGTMYLQFNDVDDPNEV